jgi:hypothetical protein
MTFARRAHNTMAQLSSQFSKQREKPYLALGDLSEHQSLFAASCAELVGSLVTILNIEAGDAA